MEKKKLTDVPLHQIQIKDAFWDKYIRLVKDVILPYQWNTLNVRIFCIFCDLRNPDSKHRKTDGCAGFGIISDVRKIIVGCEPL